MFNYIYMTLYIYGIISLNLNLEYKSKIDKTLILFISDSVKLVKFC
jgi:hypothetical protein